MHERGIVESRRRSGSRQSRRPATDTSKALEQLQDVLHNLDRAIEALETSEEPPW
jgi:molecular chaperone GrpE (heat shock protein)